MEPARNSSCVLAVEQPHFKPLREGADSYNYILLAVWPSWAQLYNKINAPDCEWLEIFRSRKQVTRWSKFRSLQLNGNRARADTNAICKHAVPMVSCLQKGVHTPATRKPELLHSKLHYIFSFEHGRHSAFSIVIFYPQVPTFPTEPS